MLKNPSLVEHALRQTLAADALSLQFKLPPPGLPVPVAQIFEDIAGGTPVVDALAVTSVWVVQILRMLCLVRQATSFDAEPVTDIRMKVCLCQSRLPHVFDFTRLAI